MQPALHFYLSGRWIPLRIPASRPESEAESIVAIVGMLTHKLKDNRSALGRRLKKFGLALRASPPLLSRSSQLIFLCGANIKQGEQEVPSARRTAIKRFIEGLSDDHHVIYAESVFTELAKNGHQKNALDLEDDISRIADKILIILESESAFCELGAFAHKSLREKLIVINDSQFKSSTSFINTGPLAAAAEAKAPIFWYPMTPSGAKTLDGIGATFTGVKNAIKSQSFKSVRISDDLSSLTTTKESLFFVHDLVLISGPLSHEEIISLLISIFGSKNFDMLKHLLGILRAASLIHSYDSNGTWVYRSVATKTFLKYEANILPLMASFRHHHLKTNPGRFSNG